MHHLPDPRFSCTIPSVHADNTPLNFRIYHPDILSRPQTDAGARWRKKGIVMAHPYAPMGGCYDDRVVGIVAHEYLKAGWIVGTFNFRGAHGSKGRTSWSGKPELDDYSTFAAFFMHYLAYLHPHPTAAAISTPPASPEDAIRPSLPPRLPVESDLLVLGGYSYGSLILKHLPPIPTLLQPFSMPAAGSAPDEIIRYARKRADEMNREWTSAARDEGRKHRGHENKLSVTMGGEETSPEKRKSSREIKRSMDDGKRSLDVGHTLRSLAHRRRKGSREGSESPEKAPESMPRGLQISYPEVHYLLISPLMPPISTLAAPALGNKFWNRLHQPYGDPLAKHPSLAIFGDHDIFTSAKKVHGWAKSLKLESGGRFEYLKVEGVGHFWHEEGAEERLRSGLRQWVTMMR